MGMDFRADNVAPAIKEALKEGFSPGDIAEELFRQQRADENYSIGECKKAVWSVILEMWHDELTGEDII